MLSEKTETYFDKKKTKFLESKAIDTSQIDSLIKERFAARQAKEWKKADEIRKRLSDMGVIIEDKPEGTSWKFNA
jgi:cysteinyl-tRNA synthetase